ncbi:MAG: alanine racemase [Candidatus Babeliaceae bacterium]|jgi:alanine racemase
MQQPWLEISRGAFHNNIDQIKKIIGQTDMGIVVKANAYGHGLFEIARLAQEHAAVAYMFTASTSEALALRNAEISKPLLALAYHDVDYADVLNAEIEFTVYDISLLRKISAAAYKYNIPARVHIKVDTGMSRIGIKPQDVLACLNEIRCTPGIIVRGIFTHLADTNEPDQLFTRYQLAQFDMLVAKIADAGIKIPSIHALASGSILENNRYSCVRIGTSAYGYHKSDLQYARFINQVPEYALQQIVTIKAPIVGWYGEHDKKYAIVACGQAYGISFIPYVHQVMINGFFVPVVRVIDMLHVVIDVSHIPEAMLQNYVTIVGPIAGISVNDHARMSKTIGNEVVTLFSPTIPRYIVP